MLTLSIMMLFFSLSIALGGHEVLYKHNLLPEDIQPDELVIIQYDSRPIGGYWNTSMRWNKAFADKHKHNYMYFTSRKNCRFGPNLLADAWCKVKAMVLADKYVDKKNSKVKAFLFLDSDAVITVNYSMTVVLSYMQKDLHWDVRSKPVALNQDGPGWSCKFTLGRGYELCLNSGTVFWMRSPEASRILIDWWTSAGEPYATQSTKFPPKWRTKWPWEQAQLYEVYRRHSERIMILTFPDLPQLPWTSKANPSSQYPTDRVEPYCFSHWPGAGCFITHYCSSKNQKRKLAEQYNMPYVTIATDVHNLDDLGYLN